MEAVYTETTRLAQLEPGCIYYCISRDPDDTNIFHFFERYTGKKAFDEHNAQPIIQKLLKKDKYMRGVKARIVKPLGPAREEGSIYSPILSSLCRDCPRTQLPTYLGQSRPRDSNRRDGSGCNGYFPLSAAYLMHDVVCDVGPPLYEDARRTQASNIPRQAVRLGHFRVPNAKLPLRLTAFSPMAAAYFHTQALKAPHISTAYLFLAKVE